MVPRRANKPGFSTEQQRNQTNTSEMKDTANMRSQSRLNRLWTMDQGLCTRIIITTLALACTFAWAVKPPKPPPDQESGYRLADLVGPAGGQSLA
jgi:hypothetical protein